MSTLVRRVDDVLDDIAAATNYAHPLVDAGAVAWLDEQFERGRGPTGKRLRPYARHMADILGGPCGCSFGADERWCYITTPMRYSPTADARGYAAAHHEPRHSREAAALMTLTLARSRAAAYSRAHHRPAQARALGRSVDEMVAAFTEFTRVATTTPLATFASGGMIRGSLDPHDWTDIANRARFQHHGRHS